MLKHFHLLLLQFWLLKAAVGNVYFQANGSCGMKLVGSNSAAASPPCFCSGSGFISLVVLSLLSQVWTETKQLQRTLQQSKLVRLSSSSSRLTVLLTDALLSAETSQSVVVEIRGFDASHFLSMRVAMQYILVAPRCVSRDKATLWFYISGASSATRCLCKLSSKLLN